MLLKPFRSDLCSATERTIVGTPRPTSLARLWGDGGRRGEARDFLAPAYAQFREGFATPDLKEAEALLNDLR
jgi:predicted ATPase